jgi:hypothetical protein
MRVRGQTCEDVCLRADFDWKLVIPYLILAAICAAYLYPFVRMFCDAPDYGVFLNGADLINQGAIPSRDFVEPQGPGSFVWLAIFFRMFGTSLATARAVLDGTGVGLALLAFYLSRRLGATGLFATLFVVALSVPLMPINSPHYDSNLFAFAALAVFLAAMDEEVPAAWLLMGAAFLCGVTTWMIQQKGLYVMVALMASAAWLLRAKAVRVMLILGGTYSAMVLLPVGIFAAMHALPDVLFANYVWPLRKYGELNAAPYAFPAFSNLLADWDRHAAQPMARAEDVATCVPFLVVAVLPVMLPLAGWIAGKKWVAAPLLPYWLTAYALWFSELHRLDIGHLRNGVMLMAVLFFSICEGAQSGVLKRSGLIISMFVALTATTDLIASLQPGRVMQSRRGLVQVEDNGALLEFLQSHTQSGEDVFVYPYQPIYYFVENLKNPTRYSYLQYHLHTEEQFHEATQDLERKKVRYVVFDSALSGERFREVFPAYRQPEQSKLIMEPYLATHYRQVSDLGRFKILQRLPE